MTTAPQEDLRIRVAGADLRSKAGRRKRDSGSILRASRKLRSARQDELVSLHGRTCEMQLVKEIEEGSPRSPARGFGHEDGR
jgi:hypothetical protein